MDVIACVTSDLLTLVFTILHSHGGPHQDFNKQLEGKAYKLECSWQFTSRIQERKYLYNTIVITKSLLYVFIVLDIIVQYQELS